MDDLQADETFILLSDPANLIASNPYFTFSQQRMRAIPLWKARRPMWSAVPWDFGLRDTSELELRAVTDVRPRNPRAMTCNSRLLLRRDAGASAQRGSTTYVHSGLPHEHESGLLMSRCGVFRASLPTMAPRALGHDRGPEVLGRGLAALFANVGDSQWSVVDEPG